MQEGAAMQAFRRDRLLSAAASAAIVGGGLAGLVLGLGVELPLIPARAALTAITTVPDRPPPHPPEPTPTRSAASAPKDSPAPEGRRAEATAIVAPPPRIVLPVTPPIVAAPNPGAGSQSSQGAGSTGTGSGAGGRGAGTGGGGDGGGDGSGANSGVAAYPRQTAGRIRFSDLPPDLRKSRTGADITVRYRIGVDGRVSGCTVVVSSGRADVDDGTCRRITERFRFRPARDARGNPVPFLMTETHGWDNVSDDEDEP
jgi:protein TonB